MQVIFKRLMKYNLLYYYEYILNVQGVEKDTWANPMLWHEIVPRIHTQLIALNIRVLVHFEVIKPVIPNVLLVEHSKEMFVVVRMPCCRPTDLVDKMYVNNRYIFHNEMSHTYSRQSTLMVLIFENRKISITFISKILIKW